MCGPEPEYFASSVGGAKKHGEVNYTLEADVPYTVVDKAHPITQGVTDFTIKDEAFFNMTWSKTPEIHVLATAAMAKTPSAGTHAGEVVPQIWTYEKSLLPGARPSAPSSGCRATTTRTSRSRRCSRCCSAASRGPASVRPTRWRPSGRSAGAAAARRPGRGGEF